MGIMQVIYRICDINSTNPPPIYQDNRLALNVLCLKSFINCFIKSDIRIHFILDKCSDEWEKELEKVELPHTVERTDLGIDGSARHAVNRALELDDDIMFQECDYLWIPQVGEIYIDAIKHFGVLSPYDHPDKYPGEAMLEMYKGLHFRTTPSTTQTYGITKENLHKYKDIILKHGYIDHAMWVELSQNGLTLRTPMPSIATHMVKDYMAPSIDWKGISSIYL